jgi:hypothetical protein
MSFFQNQVKMKLKLLDKSLNLNLKMEKDMNKKLEEMDNRIIKEGQIKIEE